MRGTAVVIRKALSVSCCRFFPKHSSLPEYNRQILVLANSPSLNTACHLPGAQPSPRCLGDSSDFALCCQRSSGTSEIDGRAEPCKKDHDTRAVQLPAVQGEIPPRPWREPRHMSFPQSTAVGDMPVLELRTTGCAKFVTYLPMFFPWQSTLSVKDLYLVCCLPSVSIHYISFGCWLPG